MECRVGTVTDLKVLFNDLIRFEIELWNAIDARLRGEHDLSLAWFELMRVVGRRELCRVNDIADELAITVGGTSKLVDRVEAAGYCRRRANPGDRRSSIIEHTPAGKRLLLKVTETFEDELEIRLGSVLSPRSLQQFGTALARLRSAEIPPRQPEGQPE